ncbi:MAG: hypothetical protein IT581_06425 [Verrucomicrobiales bacterium]|nr:hypothetical protein [Verrucomicrobiales bacterium]
MNFRQLLSQIITTLGGFLGSGQCPAAQKPAMEGVKAEFERALNAMGDGNDDKANSAAAATVVGAAGSIFTALNSLLSGVGHAIQSAIDARITSGDLIPKDQHTKLCGEAVQAAREAGITAGKAEAKTQFDAQLAEARKSMERAAVIARNGLPPATDDILRLPDAEFDAKVTEAGKRIKMAKDAGVNPELGLVVRCAWTPTGDTELKEVLGLKGGSGTGNPLADGGGAGAGGAKVSFAV